MSKLDDFTDLDDLHLLEGLSLQEIEELSEAIDPEVINNTGQNIQYLDIICLKL